MVEKQDDSIGKLESSGDLLSGRWNLRVALHKCLATPSAFGFSCTLFF